MINNNKNNNNINKTSKGKITSNYSCTTPTNNLPIKSNLKINPNLFSIKNISSINRKKKKLI